MVETAIIESEQHPCGVRNLLGVYGGVRFDLDAALGSVGGLGRHDPLSAGVSTTRAMAEPSISLKPSSGVGPPLLAETFQQLPYYPTQLYPGQEAIDLKSAGARSSSRGRLDVDSINMMAPSAIRGMK